CYPTVIPPGGFTLGPCVNSQVPFGTTSIWFDANNGGGKASLLLTGETAYTFELEHSPSLSAQATGAFSLTEEVTFDPAIFNVLPYWHATFGTTVATAVPEPGMLSLMSLAFAGLVFLRRRFG